MLECTETITLVQLVYDREHDVDRYECTIIEGVSWYGKLVATADGKGLSGATQVTVRIPESNMPDVVIQRGDYIVRGKVYAVEKQTDLKGLEYFKVLSVGNNCRGKRKDLRHWAVSGA